jgi:ATP-independent RNA helicase DbpA
MSFESLGLMPELLRAVREQGYETPTPIQAQAIPLVLEGRDLMGRAQTGTGKTAGFTLPLLQRLAPQASTSASPARHPIRALILTPTRELAMQVEESVRTYGKYIPLRSTTIFGGVNINPQTKALRAGAEILVATPGRLLDHHQQGNLNFSQLEVLVLDEADRMLDMGFADDIGDIIERTPRERQTLLFSATIPEQIRDFSRQFQVAPLDLTVNGDAGDAVLIDQTFFAIEPEEKLDALAALLLANRPESALVFCNTRDGVRMVENDLARRGFSVLSLHGELEQREREEMLVRFANRSSNVLVASDVAARGLDIKELAMVVNFDIASDLDSHIHRIGRTGRAGNRGVALSLCASSDTASASQIAKQQGTPLQWGKVPTPPAATAPLPAPFATLAVDAGRQDKMRPGDVLGALTGEAGVPGDAVGKIDVFPTRTYVAVSREWNDKALQRLRAGKIKGHAFRVRQISP